MATLFFSQLAIFLRYVVSLVYSNICSVNWPYSSAFSTECGLKLLGGQIHGGHCVMQSPLYNELCMVSSLSI